MTTNLKEQVDSNKLPSHIAIIMDGNGRWAKMRGQQRVFGHEQGVVSVRETSEAAAELGIKYLTLYAFSTENWNRPSDEIDALMELLVHTIKGETRTLMDNNIRLGAIGDLNRLKQPCYQALQDAIEETSVNTGMNLLLALSYSGRWELKQAMKKIAEKVETGLIQPSDIDENLISQYLTTTGIPDPELLIRTSGEYRISNFLLWQCAYTEMYFTPALWPDFRKNHLYEAIINYQARERRFGKIIDQPNNSTP